MEKNNILKGHIMKAVAVVYMICLSVFISYYMLKILEKNMQLTNELWPDERIAITMLMSLSLVCSLIYLTYIEKNILRLMFAYHFILLGTAVCILIPLKFMPYMLVPMVMVALYDVKAGLVTNISVCGVLMVGMGEHPLYIFATAVFVIGALSCFSLNTFKYAYQNISGMLIYIIGEILCLLAFRYYCNETGYEYEKLSFVITMSITGIVTMLVGNGLKMAIDMFVHKRRPEIILKKIVTDKFEAVMLMKNKSTSLYYHSTEVAELSRLAAKRIGANYNLAYAGGLYHDFGKLAGNEYIKEGLKLADKYQIPKDVKSIMVEHNVKSRLPKSKEAAIVMLSDTAVTAIEYIKGTMDKKDISERTIMENALNKRVNTGTLRKSGLSLEEFEIIKEALIGIKEQQ